MRLFSYIGQRSAFFLIGGMIVAAFLPELSTFMRPTLSFLVALVLAFGLAQLDLKSSLRQLFKPRQLMLVSIIVFTCTVLTTIILVTLARSIGLTDSNALMLVVFAAAPPLSSSISLSIILGFNARAALQVTLLSMLLVPVIGPLCFHMAGIEIDVNLMEMSLRIAAMIVGGFAIAILIQTIVGVDKILRSKNTFSGFAVVIMIIFIFPLFDGVAEQVIRAPKQSLQLLVLAFVLNFGGHLFIRWLASWTNDKQTASSLGFMFGNRNISIYLAVLPFNPMLSVFVAAAQIPIYITPALFQKRTDHEGNDILK